MQKVLTSELSIFQGNLLQILCTNCCTDVKSTSLFDFGAVVWELRGHSLKTTFVYVWPLYGLELKN